MGRIRLCMVYATGDLPQGCGRGPKESDRPLRKLGRNVATETLRKDKLAEQRRALPDQPGVYLFRDARGRVIYVGKAKSLRARLNSYFQDIAGLHARTQQMVTSAAAVEWTVVGLSKWSTTIAPLTVRSITRV